MSQNGKYETLEGAFSKSYFFFENKKKTKRKKRAKKCFSLFVN